MARPTHLLCSRPCAPRRRPRPCAPRCGLGELPLRATALYLASPGPLLQVIAELPDTARRVLLIAHNPAVSQLAAALQPGSGRARPLATAEFRHFNCRSRTGSELREPA